MFEEMMSPDAIDVIANTIAEELRVKVSQVKAAIHLLMEGATVPFIARYRKEATENLNDIQLRVTAQRLHYLKELNTRRAVILESIREQKKLTQDLEKAILDAKNKTHLEDLYLPFRPKRRSKAEDARKAGLGELAEKLLKNPDLSPEIEAQNYVNLEKLVPDSKAALEGARQILMEQFSEDASLLQELREYLWQHLILKSHKNASKNALKNESKKKKNANKYDDYFDYAEPIKKIPSHRALALFRARKESVIQFSLSLPDNPDYGIQKMASWFKISMDIELPAGGIWLQETVQQSWKQKLFPKLEQELLSRLRESADDDAIRVFAKNLKDLLLAAPGGPKVTIGLDPGIRTGVKVAVIDVTGQLKDYTTIFPFAPQNERQQAITELARLIAKHNVSLVSIGNGTGSRETDRLVLDMMKMYPDMPLIKVMVNEAGASVYSASELASIEFPELDVSIRGAVSIARRLQDPLAELVKIEARSIGVGQYQHDINQNRLGQSLEGVVEDCVNLVGVDLNTASVPLLTKVSGLNETLAKNLVDYRNEHGAFKDRNELKNVPRMGEKSFQQSAGFLRIQKGNNPLDASAVHPEAYPLVEKIQTMSGVSLSQMIGNGALLQSINANLFVDETFGLPTIRDVLKELEKPGRDPRPEFKTATFKEGLEDLEQLEIGMILEGVVSNVTNFGAFVDIGVHQDGLIHISSMTKRFITDPSEVIKAGEVVTVKVIEVDKVKRRIGLSMRLTNPPAVASASKPKVAKKKTNLAPALTKKEVSPPKMPLFNTAMADAFKRLKEG